MIKEIQDSIISQLQTVAGIKTVDAWAGDIDDLLKTPKKMPSLQVIYQGCRFQVLKTLGTKRAPHDMRFLVVLIHRSLKDRKTGTEQCYQIIEDVRAKLIKYKIDPYGWLWPESEELIMAEGGIFAYGLEYILKTQTGG